MNLKAIGLLISWALSLFTLDMASASGLAYPPTYPMWTVLTFVGLWIFWLILNLSYTIWMILTHFITAKKKKAMLSSLDDIVRAVIALTAIIAYFGMLIYCLVYLPHPEYQAAFDTLLKASWIPGLVVGYYFGASRIIGKVRSWLQI
jgi:hypothetical protein